MTNASMSKEDRHEMMNSMMQGFFGGMGADEKKEMCAAMMAKMTEGVDMKEMMPKMMMGMMSGRDGEKSGGMPGMMSHGGSGQQMPEMMLKEMMPHCIGMMLPMIEPDKRGEIGAAILSAIVEKGSVGMSDERMHAFLKALDDVVNPAA
jgi:ribosomal protein L12E/L44/L45/RPP1/RPP2